MKLTLFGFRSAVFYVAVVAAYFSAPYINLFFLLLAFLTLHWVMAIPWTWASTRGLSAEVDSLALVQSGQRAMVPARVEGAARRLFDVNVSLWIDVPKEKRIEYRAPRFRKGRLPKPLEVSGDVAVLDGVGRVDIELPSIRRGIYSVVRTAAWSTYPFGLLRRSASVDQGPRELVVYPEPVTFGDASGGRTAEDLLRDMLGAAVSGEGDMQPSGLRDRREGDSLRQVHWRASARRGKLVVLEWEGGGGEGLEVVLDRRCQEEELEDALRELSALVTYAREGKEILAIRSQDFVRTFGEGHDPFDRALRFLAGAEVVPADGAAPPSTSPTVLRLPRRPQVA